MMVNRRKETQDVFSRQIHPDTAVFNNMLDGR